MEIEKMKLNFLEEVKYLSTGELSEKVQLLLSNGGAKSYKYASDMMSHCIAGQNADTSVIEEVRDIYEKPVVLPNWVTLSAYTTKLLPVSPFDPKFSTIFKNNVFSISQLSKNDAKKLWVLFQIHGGQIKPSLDSSCTHLVCGKGSGKKYEEALKKDHIIVVTPDWVLQCVADQALVAADGYHPSLLIDTTEKPVSTPTITEGPKLPQPEKKEEIKSVDFPPVQHIKLLDTKPVEPTPPKVEETVVVTTASTNPRMRVASNLPPHLEQQLQQHSMMRNTAPRQQHQGTGVRMVRSGSGTSWRATSQQQIGLQRSGSQQQTIRMQQIRIPLNTSTASSTHQSTNQHLMQQLPGMVRQVKLVNPQMQQAISQHQQSAQMSTENKNPIKTENQLNGGNAQPSWQTQQQQPTASFQPAATQRVQLGPQQVMVKTEQQQNNKSHQLQPTIHLQLQQQQRGQPVQNVQHETIQQQQLHSTTSPQNIQHQILNQQGGNFNQSGQTTSLQTTSNQLPQQQNLIYFQSTGQQVLQQVSSGTTQQPQTQRIVQSQAGQLQQLQQPQQIGQVQQPQQLGQVQQPQQLGQVQQPQQLGQALPPGQPQKIQQLGQMQPTGIAHSTMVQETMKQQDNNHQLSGQQVQQQQFTVQQSSQISNVVGSETTVQQSINLPGSNTQQQQQQQQQIPGMQPVVRQQGPRPLMVQQSGIQGGPVQTVQQQQVRPLTWQQQQMLQMHIQNMNPQARQQLQQLTPQMRYVMLQKILQQQELQMQQQQQAKRIMGQQQEEGAAAAPQQQQQQQQQQLMMQRQQLQQPMRPFLQPGQRMPLNQQPQGNWQQGEQQPNQVIMSQQQQPQQVHQVQPQQHQLVPQQIVQSQEQQPQLQQSQQQQIQQQHVLQQQQGPINQQSIQVQVNQQSLAQSNQQQEQQTNSVNPKTKTALANLLSTRLQTTPSSAQQSVPAQQQQPTVVLQQQQLILQQQQQQHRNLQNITNGAITTQNPNLMPPQQQQPKTVSSGPPFTGVRIAGVPGSGPTAAGGPAPNRREFPVQQQPQQQLYAHEPGVKIPERMCLLGCVFFILDYQRTIPATELSYWTKMMLNKGAEVESTYSMRVTHVLCETTRTPLAQQAMRDGKRLVTAFWFNDVILKQQMFLPTQVLHFPTPYGEPERPCKNMLVSISGFEGEDRLRVRFMCEAVGLTYTGYFSSHHDLLVCRKADGAKFQKAREWRKPVVTVNWLAQVHFGFLNAIQQIHHPKYQQFHQPAYVQDPFKFELNMAGNFLGAWRVPIKVTQEMLEKFKPPAAQLHLKRNSSANSNPSNEAGDSPSKKKPKLEDEDKEKLERNSSNLDAILDDVIKGGVDAEGKLKPVIRFSGWDATEVSKCVPKLGGCLATSNKEVTHLVMPTLMRTPKLMCCLPTVKYVLSQRWIQESIEHGKLLDEHSYAIKETELEKKMDFNLQHLLSLPGRHLLFKGRIFYITPSVVPSRSVLREIIESSGGTVTAQQKSTKAVLEILHNDENGYAVISCPSDLYLLDDAIKSRVGIYNAEYIMSAVLTQSVIGPPFRIETQTG